jgi:PEP-CTERM motif
MRERTMTIRNYTIAALLLGSLVAAGPANAAYANFHFMYQDNGPSHNDGGTDGNNGNNGGNQQSGEGSGGDWYSGGSGETPVSAVPEPATWAMFLVGFGAIGFMVRTARRKQIVAAQKA